MQSQATRQRQHIWANFQLHCKYSRDIFAIYLPAGMVGSYVPCSFFLRFYVIFLGRCRCWLLISTECVPNSAKSRTNCYINTYTRPTKCFEGLKHCRHQMKLASTKTTQVTRKLVAQGAVCIKKNKTGKWKVLKWERKWN